MAWQIGLRLELHTLIVRKPCKDWQIVKGLELNWHFGPELVDYHWICSLANWGWIGLEYGYLKWIGIELVDWQYIGICNALAEWPRIG